LRTRSHRSKKVVYRPTARVLTVLELLQSHERMTGAELARRLECGCSNRSELRPNAHGSWYPCGG
jgi:hypothetical protein